VSKLAKNIKFKLNNKDVKITVNESDLLVDVLRDKLGLTGTKKACGTGDCGACSVLLNGKLIRSCITLACTVDGKEITTIEGIGNENNVHPIQQAFIEEGAVQCGYCTPGMIMATKALLDKNPSPTDSAIKEALSGNLCRCTGYAKIIKAIKTAADRTKDTD
jgi:xanthine dehydrogenase E subunit